MALTAALFVHVAGVHAAEPARPAELRFFGATSTIELAPVLLAAERLTGGTVSVTNGGVPDLFRPGRAMLATNAETQALRASVDNPSLRIILTVSEGFYRIVARRSAGIATLADLRGKRIATVPNTSSAYYLYRMLATVGLTDKDVTIVPVLPLKNLPGALERREVDAVTIWEPEIENAAARIGADAIEFQDRKVYRELFNLHATAEQLADPAQRARIVEFVRAVIAASERIRRDPQEAWPLVARSTGYSEELIAKVWRHEGYPGVLVPDLLDVLEAEEPWVARERSRAPRTRAQLATLIDTSVLEEARAQPFKVSSTLDAARLAAARARVARLEQDVHGAQALRAVKRVQHALGQRLEAGMWDEAAALFTRDASAQLGADAVSGRDAIARWFRTRANADAGGLKTGQLAEHLYLSPVVTLDPDGRAARGRWHEIAMTGTYGESAQWAGGIYENEYREEAGEWKIARLRYFPQFAGPYEGGWHNADKSDKVTIAPFHYDPARAGTPVPPASAAALASGSQLTHASARALATRVAALRGQLARLDDAARAQNLQNAYGFYFDRRMWDDVADLFAADGTLEIGQRGVYRGRASIRRALEVLYGPANPAPGVLNEHAQLQPVVTVSSDGHGAWARGTELAMTGVHGAQGYWGLATYDNTYVKQDGTWRIRVMHVHSRLLTDYAQGWAKSALPLPGPSEMLPPDRGPTVRYAGFPQQHAAPFRFRAPGRPMPATPESTRIATGDLASLEAQLALAARDLDTAVAYDASENVANAYGYYIDEFLWDDTANLFATDGWKELSYIGTYVGRERIRASLFARYGNGGRRAGSMAIHQKTQPVVTVAPDGRSTHLRARLFQIGSAAQGDGSYISGIYENQMVKENGVWKIAGMDLDYIWTAGYAKGWVGAAVGEQRRYAPTGTFKLPPDRLLRGVMFAPFPQVPPSAFHYRNPVSGRAPPELRD